MGTAAWGADELRVILADLYHRAAAGGADMRWVAEGLESVRESVLRRRPGPRVLEQLDHLVGEAVGSEGQPADPAAVEVLTDLRSNWIRQHGDALLEGLDRRQAAEQQRRWIGAMADWLAHFQFDPAGDLAERPPRGGPDADLVVDVAAAVPLALGERWDEVHATYRRLADHPAVGSSTQARLWAILADIRLLILARPDTATEALDRAEARLSGGTDPAVRAAVLVARARLAKERGDLEGAEELAARALEIHEADGGARTMLGDCARAAGDTERARLHYLEAVRSAPGDLGAVYSLLALHAAADPVGEAEEHIDALVERGTAISPGLVWSLHMAAGRAWRDAGDTSRALAWHDRAIAGWPDRAHGFTGRGFVHLGDGELDAARADFRHGVELAEPLFEGWWGLGFVAEREQRWEEAAALYTEGATEVVTRAPWLQARAALVSFRSGARQAGEEALLAVVAEHPDEPYVLDYAEELADEVGRTDRDAGAELARRIAAAAGPDYAGRAAAKLGDLAEVAGDLAAAEAHFADAIRLDPDRADGYAGLMRIRRLQERPAEARSVALDAPSTVTHAEVFRREASLAENALANRLYFDGRYSEAVPHYQQATTWNPRDAVLHANLARALERDTSRPAAERLAAAVDAMTQARSLDPADPEPTRLRDLAGLVDVAGEAALERVPVGTPVAIEVGSDLVTEVATADGDLRPELIGLVEDLRAELRSELGLVLPGVRFRDDPGREPRGWAIVLDDVVRLTGTADADAAAPMATVPGALCRLVMRDPSVLVDAQVVAGLLEDQDAEVAAGMASGRDLAYLTGVIRGLAAERIPCADLGRICELAAHHARAGDDRVVAMEAARAELLPAIRPDAPRAVLDDQIVAAVAAAIVHDGAHPTLALPPDVCQDVVAALAAAAGEVGDDGLLVVPGDRLTRHFICRLLQAEQSWLVQVVTTAEVAGVGTDGPAVGASAGDPAGTGGDGAEPAGAP